MHSDNVVDFTGYTRLDIPTDKVLTQSIGTELDEVVVIGTTVDGGMYFNSSRSDGGKVLWLLERARHLLMKTADEMEGG